MSPPAPGSPDGPEASGSSLLSGYGTYESAAQIGGGSSRLQYYVTGLHNSTDRRLDPVTQTPAA